MKTVKRLIEYIFSHPLYIKYREIILYVFFGGVTTFVSLASFMVCKRLLLLHTDPGNIISWILSVTTAFVTNRAFVFRSEKKNAKSVVFEMLSFYSSRLLTGGVDLIIVHIGIETLGLNDFGVKAASSVIVLILNYIASKLFVFRKKPE